MVVMMTFTITTVSLLYPPLSLRMGASGDEGINTTPILPLPFFLLTPQLSSCSIKSYGNHFIGLPLVGSKNIVQREQWGLCACPWVRTLPCFTGVVLVMMINTVIIS